MRIGIIGVVPAPNSDMLNTRIVLSLLAACALALVSLTDLAAQGRGQGRGGGQPPTTRGRVNKPATPPAQPAARGNQTPKIVVQPKLATHVQPLLPGLDLDVASSGFRNLGQFVAAAHVSNNLGIPFLDLKSQMVDQGRSLGQSIQQLRPGVNFSAEATKAERQARATIERGRR